MSFLLRHPFEGEGQYCESWRVCRPTGNPTITGVFTMKIQCSYPRDCHHVAKLVSP